MTHLLQNHLPKHIFEPIITRDTPNLLPKPEPAGILHIARQWKLDNRAESMIMVGDIPLTDGGIPLTDGSILLICSRWEIALMIWLLVMQPAPPLYCSSMIATRT